MHPSYVDEALVDSSKTRNEDGMCRVRSPKEGLLPLLSVRECVCHDKTGYAWSPEV